jgi:hypothetical protein
MLMQPIDDHGAGDVSTRVSQEPVEDSSQDEPHHGLDQVGDEAEPDQGGVRDDGRGRRHGVAGLVHVQIHDVGDATKDTDDEVAGQPCAPGGQATPGGVRVRRPGGHHP